MDFGPRDGFWWILYTFWCVLVDFGTFRGMAPNPRKTSTHAVVLRSFLVRIVAREAGSSPAPPAHQAGAPRRAGPTDSTPGTPKTSSIGGSYAWVLASTCSLTPARPWEVPRGGCGGSYAWVLASTCSLPSGRGKFEVCWPRGARACSGTRCAEQLRGPEGREHRATAGVAELFDFSLFVEKLSSILLQQKAPSLKTLGRKRAFRTAVQMFSVREPKILCMQTSLKPCRSIPLGRIKPKEVEWIRLMVYSTFLNGMLLRGGGGWGAGERRRGDAPRSRGHLGACVGPADKAHSHCGAGSSERSGLGLLQV